MLPHIIPAAEVAHESRKGLRQRAKALKCVSARDIYHDQGKS